MQSAPFSNLRARRHFENPEKIGTFPSFACILVFVHLTYYYKRVLFNVVKDKFPILCSLYVLLGLMVKEIFNLLNKWKIAFSGNLLLTC